MFSTILEFRSMHLKIVNVKEVANVGIRSWSNIFKSTYIWFYEKFMIMWPSVKFQFALLFTILIISAHLGVVQLKDKPADSHVEKIANVERSHTQEKDTHVRIPQIARQKSPSHQIQEPKGGEHLWLPQRQTLANNFTSHQSREVAEHFILCEPYHWPCVDGLFCI